MQSFFYLLLFVSFCVSCSRSRKQAKFIAAVEQVYQLDSTKIGISTILSNLNVPWEIVWGPDNQIWFTQQSGTISKVDPHTGKEKTLLYVPGVVRIRTLGLLGMAVSLDKSKPYVFIDYTRKKEDSTTISRLVRYTYTHTYDTLKDPLILLEVPANNPGGHNGSRVVISPDDKVFWATGDAGQSENAQNISSLNGKILRLNMDGSIPKDNPIPGSPIWSLGYRNIQGLTFTPDGMLFSSEHGDATDDELNLIVKGANYGYPEIEGYCDSSDEQRFCDSIHTIEPLKVWTPTIAPSGMDYYHSEKIPKWYNAILLTTLKGISLGLGVSLKVLKFNPKKDSILTETTCFKGVLGRLRAVCVSPEGDVYVSTSNRDWNPLGNPASHDDRIIRIAKISDLDNVSQVDINNPMSASSILVSSLSTGALNGKAVYQEYCSSCHKSNGNGVNKMFPPLDNSRIVTGERSRLITIILKGDIAIKDAEKSRWSEGGMPSFGSLDDDKITDIVNYIRTSWHNDSDSTNVTEVKTIRKKLK